jgi:pyridoxamine 5'-phosphate oxidase family protein
MSFTERELGYLRSQPLGRLATVGPHGQPDVAAVAFRVYEDGTIAVAGMDIAASRKGRNVHAGADRVALIVDDLETVDPWRPRGIRIYGRAELLEATGDPPHGGSLRITPETSWSWGIEPPPPGARGFNPQRTDHRAGRGRG